MTVESLRSSQPVPGYTITQRIGAGGYGEVWRADAPGGLVKAVKLIYGYHDEERASRELKALNRIKQVRHPFLLSLERIEILDGQLVIVTELADMSLKDRFEQCKAAGLVGIPREELLIYMHDAADALDYMSEQFGLQHLDVKPENLLLLGGRVKVADFGLVKDLQEATCSMMGGMTPLYASPEVFDGRASKQSDQYSLGVVYQEMLTGILPFPGKTVAQLAAQHTQSRPKLSSLPLCDQNFIQRALSKSPDDRFNSTRDLVEALIAAGRAAENRMLEFPASPSDADTTSLNGYGADFLSETQNLGSLGAIPDRAAEGVEVERMTPVRMTPPPRRISSPAKVAQNLPQRLSAEVTEAPPLDPAQATCGLRPTLYVGIGGTAAHVLRHLRARLSDRCSDPGAVSCWQMLLLDTDSKCLASSTQPGVRGALRHEEIVPMPLRRPQEYGAQSAQYIQWLSRRWIYNIPRSLQTGGIRPLGRLALIDHAECFLTQLRDAIRLLAAPESAEQSSIHSGLVVRDPRPRAVVVASISGGTGSGTVLDVAQTVRQALLHANLEADDVTLLLIHSTPRVSTARDLASASAYAFLSEWDHHARTNRWPASLEAGPLAMCDSVPARAAYLVHLGDELSEGQWDSAAERLGEYLSLDATSAVGSLLDATRSEGIGAGCSTLRSCGLRIAGGGPERFTSTAADLVARATLDHWSGDAGDAVPQRCSPSTAMSALDTPEPPRESRRKTQVELLAEQRALAMGLETTRLLTDVSASFERQAGSDPESFARALAARLLADASQGTNVSSSTLAERVNSVLGSYATGADCGHGAGSPLLSGVENDLKKMAIPRAEALEQWLLQLIDASGLHLAGAQHAAVWFATRFRTLEEEAATQLEHVGRELAEAAGQVAGGSNSAGRTRWSNKPMTELGPWLNHYCRLRLRENLFHALRRFLQFLAGRLPLVSDLLRDLRRETALLANGFPRVAFSDEIDGEDDLEWPEFSFALANYLRGRVQDLAVKVSERLRESVLVSAGGFRKALVPGAGAYSALQTALRIESRRAVAGALEQFDAAGRLLDGGLGSEKLDQRLAAWLEAARPQLLSAGGARRVWLVGRGGSTAQGLATRFVAAGTPVTLVPDTGGSLSLLYEAQGIPVINAALEIAQNRESVVAIAARLHARIDIDWKSLGQAEAIREPG